MVECVKEILTVTNTRRLQECARMMSDLSQACIVWKTIPLEDKDADYNEQEEKAEDVDVHDVTDADDDADAGADADDDFEKCVRPYCPHLPY